MVRLLFLAVLVSLVPMNNLKAQTTMSPCDDELYLELKRLDLDELSERQYEYFSSKSKECDQYQKQLLEEQAEIEKASAASKSAESVRKYLGWSNWILIILLAVSMLPILLLL